MRSAVFTILALFTAAVNAHFRLQFPPPRGPFDEDNEPTFCGILYLFQNSQSLFSDSICFSTDGYTDGPASNRTQFPLSGGFFTLDSEHPQWTGQIVLHIRVFIGADSDMLAGVLVSTAENVTSFQNFSQVNSFFQVQGEGDFCIPLDFSKSNITGLRSGQNVTIQVLFIYATFTCLHFI